MGLATFLLGLTGAAVMLLLVAALAAMAIAFILPERLAGGARRFVEWAAVLSGAGYIALALTRFPDACSHPWLLSIAVALSYLPLGVLLFLHALEPHWSALVAGRGLGLSVWHIALAIAKEAQLSLLAAMGLCVSRLFADMAVLLAIIGGKSNNVSAAFFLPISILLFVKSIQQLVACTEKPAYPPLFGPLPELPPRLKLTPKLKLLSRLIFDLSIAVGVVAIALELRGFGILRQWTSGSPMAFSGTSVPTGALSAAIGAALPVVAGAGLLAMLWIWSRPYRPSNPELSLAVAAFPPILFVVPAVTVLDEGWFPWMALAMLGLAAYIVIQDGASRQVHVLAARYTLLPGKNTAAAAAAALGLSSTAPYSRVFPLAQASSAAAAWFASAACLGTLSCSHQVLTAAHALVWGLMAGALRLLALGLLSGEPRPRLGVGAFPATLEAFFE